MRILIVGGTHGDERTGVDVVSRLKRNPVIGIGTLIANPRATQMHRRFVETDLNRSFGVRNPRSYEEKRALRLARILKQHDLIIEFHNTVSRTMCAILTTPKPTVRQLRTVAHLGLDRVVVMPAGHSLSGQNPSKTVSIEVSTGESKFSAQFFVDRIKAIGCEMNIASSNNLTLYRYRGIKVSMATLAKTGLGIDEFLDFEPIDEGKLRLLGLNIEAQVPFLIGEKAYGEDFAFNIAEVIETKRGK